MLTDKKTQYYNTEVWGGIECTINRVEDQYFDQLQYANFYQHPQQDAIVDLGIRKIRFPILWEKHQPELNTTIDWAWTFEKVETFKKHNIEVIAGLLHHGSGPKYTDLLDENFPFLFAAYAKEVAEKFPWINYYTPVNEPLTTARFSGLYGIWYPHKKDTRSFLLMLLNELKGTVLAMQEIRKINPSAQLVQTEDLAKTYSTPLLQYQADFENERRWLTFDLLSGNVTSEHRFWNFFIDHGIPVEKLHFFQQNACAPDIFGFNYYVTSERFIDEKTYLYPEHTHGGNAHYQYADVEAVRVELEEETGIEVLLKEAWQRFKKPIAITEVHLHCHREEQLRWFKYVWDACIKLRKKGLDIVGVTAWALYGSFGWNKLLTQPGGDYEPGVFDLRSGYARPTALKTFIKEISSSNKSFHPLSLNKGWWQRDGRFSYIPYIQNPFYQNSPMHKDIVLIIGKSGTLGQSFAAICASRSIQYKLLSRKDCDIGDIHSIESAIDLYKPWAIINAAGYVRVDDAEKEKEHCFRENYAGPVNLSIACKKHGIKLLTFSSDLVFDGGKTSPYLESDFTNPLNVYGKSKAEAEAYLTQEDRDALIIRTSAFFGPTDQHNFAHWVLNKITNQEQVTVANDMYISPTYVPDLVHVALDLLIDQEKGIWNLSNAGVITWADFAYETANKFELDNSYINAVPLQDLAYPAQRPYYCVLGSERGSLMPSLESAIQRFFDEKKTQDLSIA